MREIAYFKKVKIFYVIGLEHIHNKIIYFEFYF